LTNKFSVETAIYRVSSPDFREIPAYGYSVNLNIEKFLGKMNKEHQQDRKEYFLVKCREI